MPQFLFQLCRCRVVSHFLCRVVSAVSARVVSAVSVVSARVGISLDGCVGFGLFRVGRVGCVGLCRIPCRAVSAVSPFRQCDWRYCIVNGSKNVFLMWIDIRPAERIMHPLNPDYPDHQRYPPPRLSRLWHKESLPTAIINLL